MLTKIGSQQAWAIAGELIFWLNRSDCENTSARMGILFQDLMGRPQAVPDVLRHLGSGYMGPHRSAPLSVLLAEHRDELRAVLNTCLEYEGRLTSAFKGAEYRQRELFSWLISMIAEIGNDESIGKLRLWTDHAIYGKDAIRAIETIEQRKAIRVRA